MQTIGDRLARYAELAENERQYCPCGMGYLDPENLSKHQARCPVASGVDIDISDEVFTDQDWSDEEPQRRGADDVA